MFHSIVLKKVGESEGMMRKRVYLCDIIIYSVKIMEYIREFTPERITELGKNEIFVFGSNIHGMHGGGAARIANEYFGAEWGVGEGLTGQCYALPTMEGL